MKKVLFTLLAAAAVAGCSKANDEYVDIATEKSNIVKFSSDKIDTRVTDNAWDGGEFIGIYSAGFTTDVSNVKYEAKVDGTKNTTFEVVAAADQILFPNIASGEVTFSAYYPHSDVSDAAKIVSDITTTDQDSGLLFGTADKATSYGEDVDAEPVSFTFTHSMAKIELTVTANDDLENVSGLVVTMEDIRTTANYDITDGEIISISDSVTDDVEMTQISNDDTTAVLSAVLHPGDYSTLGSPTFSFVTNGNTYTVTFDKTLQAGLLYKFSVKLGNDYPTFDTDNEITDWDGSPTTDTSLKPEITD